MRSHPVELVILFFYEIGESCTLYLQHMEEKSTPASRSVAVASIVLVLVALSVAMPSSWFSPKTKSENQKWKIDVSKIKDKKAVATDANSDGQVTWKEVIAETLPMDEQTKENLKKEQIDPKAIEDLNNPNNLTASFSKNLYLSASYLDQNGMTDEASQKAIASKLMAQEAAKIKPTIYTYKDIKVAKTESKESIKAYGNALVLILDTVITKKITTDEIASLEQFEATKDASVISPFIADKKRLDIIVKKLTEMQVPPSAIIYHTLVLNRTASYRDVIANISVLESDPIRATLAVRDLRDVSKNFLRVFENISTYFDIKNVTFSSSEPGYVFVIGYTLH